MSRAALIIGTIAPGVALNADGHVVAIAEGETDCECCGGGCPISGVAVVAGGQFTNAGGTACNRVAAWQDDGMGSGAWIPLQGLNGTVFALASVGGRLYAGGSFTASIADGSIPGIALNRLARWNCDRWEKVGNGAGGGVNGTVTCLKRRRNSSSLPDTLLIGGDFTANSLGTPLSRTAEFSTTSGAITSSSSFIASPNALVRTLGWRDDVGPGLDNPDVDVGSGIIGGDFTLPSARISTGAGSFTTLAGSGANGNCLAALHDVTPAAPLAEERAWVGGFFTVAGGAACNRFGYFKRTLGSGDYVNQGLLGFAGPTSGVFALYYSNVQNKLFIGGSFTQRQDGVSMLRVASSVDGQANPVAVGGGLTGGDVNAFCEYRSDLIAAGTFLANNLGQARVRIAQFSGGAWQQMGGTGFSDPLGLTGGPVQALCQHDFGGGAAV